MELAAMTPVKALKASAGLMMQTLIDAAAWVAKCHAAMERLKAKEVAAKAGASAQEGAGVGKSTRGPEQVEAAPSGTRHDGPGSGGLEPGSTTRTPETVEAGRAETSVRDQTDVKEMKEVVKAPQNAGKEEEQPELQIERGEPQRRLQQQQRGEQLLEPQSGAKRGDLDQLGEPVIEAKREVAMPPPNVQAKAPADGRPVPPQGSTLAVIDLTVDDPPSDKGKQKADV
jgi:hypothetical protein